MIITYYITIHFSLPCIDLINSSALSTSLFKELTFDLVEIIFPLLSSKPSIIVVPTSSVSATVRIALSIALFC